MEYVVEPLEPDVVLNGAGLDKVLDLDVLERRVETYLLDPAMACLRPAN